jgi:hypothetical protein
MARLLLNGAPPMSVLRGDNGLPCRKILSDIIYQTVSESSIDGMESPSLSDFEAMAFVIHKKKTIQNKAPPNANDE